MVTVAARRITVLAVALAVVLVSAADASAQVAVYVGKLPRGRESLAGEIQVRVRGDRVTVVFYDNCENSEVAYPALVGREHGGHFSISREEVGETHDETSGPPSARITARGRVSPTRVVGVFSLAQEEAGSIIIGGEGAGTAGCRTGKLRFTARRTRR
jgi:hypothetical protein